jgi:hypothetical protein
LVRNSSKTKREFFKILGPFIIGKLEKGIPELISERIIKTGVVKEIARVLKPGGDLIIVLSFTTFFPKINHIGRMIDK